MKNEKVKSFAIGLAKTSLAVVIGLVAYDFGKRVIIPKFKKVESAVVEETV